MSTTDDREVEARKRDWKKNETRTLSDWIQNPEEYVMQVDFICNYFNFDLFIDVGPGVAFSEAWAVRSRYPSCSIIGFEPQVDRCKKLANSFYPGRLFQNPVSDVTGEITGNMGISTGRSDFVLNASEEEIRKKLYKKVKIASITVDAIAKLESFSNAFIWADCEGAEKSVLDGSKELIESGKLSGFLVELTTDLLPKDQQVRSTLWTDTVKYCEGLGYVPLAVFNCQPTHFDCIFKLRQPGDEPSIDFLSVGDIQQLYLLNFGPGVKEAKYESAMPIKYQTRK